MTTERRPGPTGPKVAKPIVAARDYPERRSARQLAADGERVRQQVDLLSSAESYERTMRIVERIRARQDKAPKRYALPFDVYRLPDADRAGSYVLVARGQLVVRVEAPDGLRHTGDEQAAAGAAARRSGDIQEQLRELGYAPLADDPDAVLRPSRDTRTVVYRSAKPAGELARDIEVLRSRGVTAAMNLVVPLGHLIKGDDYPHATTGLGQPPGGNPARRVRVAVVDTGIAGTGRGDGWLTGVVATADDVDPLDVVPDIGRLDWCSGHGTFAAGVVQQTAPLCEIVMYRCTHSDGLGTEKDVADALIQAAEEGHAAGVPTIINASVGTPAAPGLPPVAMQAAVELIAARYPDVLIVASAGNSATSEPMYPAAFDGVVAVGAVELSGPPGNRQLRPAPFSNFGPWVRCSSIGVGVLSTFVAGLEPPEPMTEHPDELFPADAVAAWSGTSFSAPQISGAVARLCYENPGLTPRAALEALLAGHSTIGGYGTVVTLLPGTPVP